MLMHLNLNACVWVCVCERESFCVYLHIFFATRTAYINTETEICTKKINNIYTYVYTQRESECAREGGQEKLATGSNKRMKFITMNTLYGELFHFSSCHTNSRKRKTRKRWILLRNNKKRKKVYNSTIVKSSGVLHVYCASVFCSVKASNKKVHEGKYPFAFILPIKMKIISNIYFIRTNKEKTNESEWMSDG